jgi:hypothetical protein
MATNPKLPVDVGPRAVPDSLASREQKALRRYLGAALIVLGVLIVLLVWWFVHAAGKGPATTPASPPKTTQVFRVAHWA